MQAFSVVCYTVSMTWVRRWAGLGLLGVAGLSVTRSSPAPEPPGAGAALANTTPRTREATPALPDTAVAADASEARAAVYSSAILRSRAHAQERILGRDQGTEDAWGHTVPARRVALDEGLVPAPQNGNALGSFVPVENEAALAHFHQALDALIQQPDQKNKVRVAAYGASHTQADIYASYLRYYLQERFGNGGPGFIPFGMERAWLRHEFSVKSHGVQVEYVQGKGPPPSDRLGLSGSAALVGANAWLRVAPQNAHDPDLAASQYSLFYAAEPEGAELSVSVDDEPPQLLT